MLRQLKEIPRAIKKIPRLKCSSANLCLIIPVISITNVNFRPDFTFRLKFPYPIKQVVK